MAWNGSRRDVETQTDSVREHLIKTIRSLEERGHEAVDWRLQLRTHAREIVVTSALITAALALVAASSMYRLRRQAAVRGHERLLALRRAWEHPDRVAQRRRHWVALFFGVCSTVASVALAAFAKRLQSSSASNRTLPAKADENG